MSRLMPVVQPSKTKKIPGYDANHRWIERSTWSMPCWVFALVAGAGLGFAVAMEVMR